MATSVAFSYNELISELQVFLEEASAEYVADLPTLVKLGESRVATDFNFEIFDVVVTGALTAAVFVQAIKPTDWQGTKSADLCWSIPMSLRRRTSAVLLSRRSRTSGSQKFRSSEKPSRS